MNAYFAAIAADLPIGSRRGPGAFLLVIPPCGGPSPPRVLRVSCASGRRPRSLRARRGGRARRGHGGRRGSSTGGKSGDDAGGDGPEDLLDDLQQPTDALVRRTKRAPDRGARIFGGRHEKATYFACPSADPAAREPPPPPPRRPRPHPRQVVAPRRRSTWDLERGRDGPVYPQRGRCGPARQGPSRPGHHLVPDPLRRKPC